MIAATMADPAVAPATPVFAILTIISALITASGGLIVWFKLRPDIKKIRAETRRVDLDAALAGDKAEDEHWQAIVKAQTEAIVQPLREEVGRLTTKVDRLEKEVESFRSRYWRSIAFIRLLLARDAKYAPDAAPAPPSEIAADI